MPWSAVTTGSRASARTLLRTLPRATTADLRILLAERDLAAAGRCIARVGGVLEGGTGFLRGRRPVPALAPGPSRVARSAFEPVLVTTAPRHPSAGIPATTSSTGIPYRRALVLVREEGRACGALETDLPETGLGAGRARPGHRAGVRRRRARPDRGGPRAPGGSRRRPAGRDGGRRDVRATRPAASLSRLPARVRLPELRRARRRQHHRVDRVPPRRRGVRTPGPVGTRAEARPRQRAQPGARRGHRTDRRVHRRRRGRGRRVDRDAGRGLRAGPGGRLRDRV